MMMNGGETVNSSSGAGGEQTLWGDVSALIQAASLDLRDGELIHGDNFNLFASMSALEIMDPKMDSGIVCDFYSVEEAIDLGAAPVPLSLPCLIDTIDHLLSLEATWHKGQTLSQTLFSCIYLLRPARTSHHALLHSFVRIIRATCNSLLSLVSSARTHEEEDIFIMTYGLPLAGDEDDDKRCLSLLSAVEETISRQLRACKAPSSKKRLLQDIEPLQSNADLEEGYCRSLLCRLRFRKHFYHILTSMRRPQGRGFELARKHIASCLSELEGIQSSSEFLRSSASQSHNNIKNAGTTASGRLPVGFDATLNNRSSAPTPPRAISTLSFAKALGYFEKLLHDLNIICSSSLDMSLEGVLHFVVQFQKSQPDLVARAHLQALLVQNGKLYGRDAIFSVISTAAAIPEIATNHDLENNEYFVQLAQLVSNLLKVLCTNTAWQRRKLGKILQDWRVIFLQLDLAFRKEFGESTIPIDENLSRKVANHILNWVEKQTYWVASRFLKLGFELELYSQNEYCMVYWYMYVVLFKLAEKTHLTAGASTDTAKRKVKKKRDSTKEIARDYQIPPSVLLIECNICLAEGTTMMLAALRNELKTFQCPGPFNTEQEIFFQHFELLQKASVPEHISYHSFKESTVHTRLSTLGVHNYFKDAQRIAKELKGSFANDPERVAELKQLEQVAEHNSVALNVISRLGALDPSLKVSFEFSHHPHFPIAVVKRS